jgi:hypothetical protein
MNENFDPVSVLTNTKQRDEQLHEAALVVPVEDVLMSRTLWPES